MKPSSPFQKILLFGTGYVGKRLLQHLSSDQLTTISFASPCPESPHHLTMLKDFSPIEKEIKQAEVIILAIAPSNENSYSDTYLKTAEWVIIQNPNAKIIYLSSTSIYGDQHGNVVDEQTAPNPSSEQAKILLATEEVIAQSGFFTIFRLSGIYGPNRGFAKRLDRSTPLPGTGEEIVNKVHVEDVIRAVLFAIENDIPGIFNLSDDEHPKRCELYEAIAKSLKLPSPVFDPSLQSRHLGNRIVNSEKIKSKGFEFLHPSLDSSI